MNPFSLEGKTALVTGASRGIGQGIAKALGQAGALVVGSATTQAGADNISNFLNTENIHGYGVMLNVTSAKSIDEAISVIKNQSGGIHILVNNAAITKDNLFLRMRQEEWLEVVNTNLNSLYSVSKACIRDMIKARFGRIINIGSVVGSTGNPGQANYCAAKAGMLGFSKALALEVGSRNITINTIAPGFVSTDMTNALSEEQKQSIYEKIPMQKPGTAQDIGLAAVFLASEAASYITGQTLHVNGGMFMN